MLFQITGIAILLVFYGCYFIKMAAQRRKGIQTDQIGRGKVGFVRFVEITMKIATYLAPVAEAVSILMNRTLLSFSLRVVGAGIGVLGTAVFVLSVVTMGDSWRAGVSNEGKTELVTNGIYQISRNPAFLGFDLVYIGILMMFFNGVLLAASVFAILLFHLQIVNVEEEYLLEAFGEEYLRYRKKVCRYIGRKQ